VSSALDGPLGVGASSAWAISFRARRAPAGTLLGKAFRTFGDLKCRCVNSLRGDLGVTAGQPNRRTVSGRSGQQAHANDRALLRTRVFDAKMPAMRKRIYTEPCAFTSPDGVRCHGNARARGLCSSHLWQLAHEKPLTPLRGRHGRKYDGCTFPGCGKPHQSGGLCTGHKGAESAASQDGRPA
jgi:hypothetical protein